MTIKHHTQAVTPGKIPWESYNEDHDYSNLDASKLQGSTKAQIIEEAQEGMGGGEPGQTTVINKPTAQFSKGMIIFWSGKFNEVPAGWHLCNGKDGTPDLSDRFIMGTASENNIGETGGKTTLNHSDIEVEVSSHENGNVAIANHNVTQPANHIVTQPSDHVAHTRGVGTLAITNHSTVSNKQGSSSGTVVTTATHTFSGSTANPSAILTHTGTAVSVHSGTAVDAHAVTVTQPDDHDVEVTQPNPHTGVMPPYYKLALIMFIGGENLTDCIIRVFCSLPTNTSVEIGDDTVDRGVYDESGEGTQKIQTFVVQKGSVLSLQLYNNSGSDKVLGFEYESAEDGRQHGLGISTVPNENSRQFRFVADQSGDLWVYED